MNNVICFDLFLFSAAVKRVMDGAIPFDIGIANNATQENKIEKCPIIEESNIIPIMRGYATFTIPVTKVVIIE